MERRAIVVHGVVQGVGFRPFVHGLASRLELAGFVKNRMGGALIEVEGEARSLDHFLTELATKPPQLAASRSISRPINSAGVSGGSGGPITGEETVNAPEFVSHFWPAAQ